jgi:hypothetical protein
MEKKDLGKTSIAVILDEMLEYDSILDAMRKERLESKGRTEAAMIHERKEILKKLSSKKDS